jgi:hypothetical protein
MQNNLQLAESKGNNLWIISMVSIVVVLGLWLWAYFSLRNVPFIDRGTFGDMFGAVNAVFSGLAFGGIIITIWMQKHELELQRKELISTRTELHRSASSQERSEEALSKQAANLKASAKLSALSTLVEYYNRELEKNYITSNIMLKETKEYQLREKYVQDIIDILNEKV